MIHIQEILNFRKAEISLDYNTETHEIMFVIDTEINEKCVFKLTKEEIQKLMDTINVFFNFKVKS